MIEGVVFKDLVTHADERGYFREVIRKSDAIFKEGFGQCSHAVVLQGVIKAWHVHSRQIDWWYIISGLLKVALHDTRAESPTYRETMEFLLGDFQSSRVVRIPQGIAHGYKCINGPAHVLYIMSHEYDPTDEGRIMHNDPSIGYDWINNSPIK